MSLYSRQLRRLTVRKAVIVVLVFVTLVDLLRYLFLRSQSPRSTLTRSYNGKIFIASTHWNNEKILRSHWNNQIADIATHFGPHNIYVSVYESGSWDDSKGALRDLEDKLQSLGVEHKITLDPTTHEDELKKTPGPSGWVDTPRHRKELRRIPYLSALRNISLQPLRDLWINGTEFDKIMFLNDVVFDIGDVEALLDTNKGEYAAACAMDFAKPPQFYDTFALRDSEGHEALMQRWPYFRSRRSRNDLKATVPVNVVSCWNGMVVMDAAPFYNEHHRLAFRGIPDSLAQYHLEGSECCLIHQDNPLSGTHGVFVNPSVRVGYNQFAYDAMKTGLAPDSIFVYLWRIWENRLRRWFTKDWLKQRLVRKRVSKWKSADLKEDEKRREKGLDCLINEMQVLVNNGWAHL